MALGYRLYQIFRTFWVQNTLAFFIGGVLCFLMFAVAQGAAVLYQAVDSTHEAFYIQILPETPPHSDVAGGAQASAFDTDRLLYSLSLNYPDMTFRLMTDDSVPETVISMLNISRAEVDALGIHVPATYIEGRFANPTSEAVRAAIAEIGQMPGVQAVDGEVNFYMFLQSARWVIALAFGVLIAFLFVFLFYLTQFMMVQMIVVRREEIQLEYLLGASGRYQKLPYMIYISLFCVFSVGVAGLIWLFAVSDRLPALVSWLSASGLAVPSSLDFYDPKLLAAFLAAFTGVVFVLFHWAWRYHFRRTIWDRRL